MIKECKTIKEFNRRSKEYYKYHYSRFTCSSTESEIKDIITGLSFKITSEEQFNDNEVRSLFMTNVCILDEAKPLLGKYCNCSGNRGIFIGIEATEEDFYYMLKKEDGEIIYESCVCKIEDWSEIAKNKSDLENQPKCIIFR